jgi:predicted nucleotidyltransferase
MGVGVEDPGELLFDEPGEVEIGIGGFEKLEGGGGMDHIPQGREADQRDPFPVPAHRFIFPMNIFVTWIPPPQIFCAIIAGLGSGAPGIGYNSRMFFVNERGRNYGRPRSLSVVQLRKCFADERLSAVRFAALFGSRARGEVHEASDYDLAVLGDASLDRGWGIAAELWNRIGEVCGLNEWEMDLVDLSRASPTIKRSIAENFILLKGDERGFRKLLGEDSVLE